MARKIDYIELIDKIIGAKIQELRLASGLSRQQLGEKIEVTHQQLQKYEKGTNRVSAGRLAIIAKFLNKPVAYFFENIDSVNASSDVNLNDHQRMCIEVSRNFMRIKSSEHKDAVNILVKTLAANQNDSTV